MNNPGYPRGVPTPYVAHVHPYPTRFHGGIWTRPVFGMPQLQTPSTVFIPGRDIDMQADKPYTGSAMGQVQYDVGEGIFRPGGYGGGVFDGNLAGAPALGKHGGELGASTPTQSDADNYPYGKYSAQTKQLQDKINSFLLKHQMCPIVADGKLGAATCGAALLPPLISDPAFLSSGAFAPTTCQDLKSPLPSSGGCGTGPAAPAPAPNFTPQQASLTSMPILSSSTKKALLFLAGATGAVAVVYYVKKRRGRR